MSTSLSETSIAAMVVAFSSAAAWAAILAHSNVSSDAATSHPETGRGNTRRGFEHGLHVAAGGDEFADDEPDGEAD